MNYKTLFLGILFMYCVPCTAQSLAAAIQRSLKVYVHDESPQQNYGLKKLREAVRVTVEKNFDEADVAIISSKETSVRANLQSAYSEATPEGFSIQRRANGKAAVIASDPTGIMYGIMDLAEQLQMGRSISTITEKAIKPQLRIRGIKFNLPWNSYRKDESLQLHEETLRDLRYWESFLDMMAENHFNALTLWNLHPFSYMIRAINFPEACPYSDEELASWQQFWHGLFRMASDRGIKTYVFNWNIMVSHSFAKKYGVADYCLNDYQGKDFIGKGDYSPVIQQYMRESVTQLINEYPELTGIGASQNERMEGVDEQVWQDWIMNTYCDALDSASRKVELIIRAHTHPAPELTRKAVEDNAYRLGTVYMDVKFNWSHSHATPDLMYIHGGSRSKSLWEPVPKNYKMIYTMRNEDFFVLRWGEPEFIREVVRRNSQDFVGGFLIGSETYIPGKEYITRSGKHLTWKYAFEKQWLFYQMWGRLMYDPETADDVFASTFNQKYGIRDGCKLIKAHTLADKMPLSLASFYSSSWDFTLYSEGFLANAPSRMKCLYDSLSPFISVNEIIETTPLDTNLVSIADYVSGIYSGSQKVTPLQLAAELRRNGEQALSILQDIPAVHPTLIHEIDDIRAWAYLSIYFSEKLKGGTALQKYRLTGNRDFQKESIANLENALTYWNSVVAVTSKYMDEIPLMHLNPKYVNSGNTRPLAKFSWRNLIDEVKNDIAIAEERIK
ncbi:MAG: hypothetical protein NTV54_15615 [Ignavibacteriales bacterium]|nr:hypothetical protein [Ignavibacteriales bacterium]